MTLLEQARAFRAAYNQEMLDAFTKFGFIKRKLWTMQLDLIEEEACEFLEASDEYEDDPMDSSKATDVLKELADLVFVCYQFAAAFNLDLDEAMNRIFESNMSKLDEDGSPIYRDDGKVLKGPNYKAPSLSDLVKINSEAK